MPIGRLVIVKISDYEDNTPSNYEKLKNSIKVRYIFNQNVKDVFINGGGTITIDCRN